MHQLHNYEPNSKAVGITTRLYKRRKNFIIAPVGVGAFEDLKICVQPACMSWRLNYGAINNGILQNPLTKLKSRTDIN